MKKNISPVIYCLVLILLVSLSLTTVSASVAKGSHNFKRLARLDPATPGAVIKTFYTWYINAIEAGTDPFKKGRATLQKYVTLRLIRQIERAESDGSDADAFLQTQEWDKNWANSIVVSQLKVKASTATAIATFDDETNYPRVLITLVKQSGTWKIDKVKNAPQ